MEINNDVCLSSALTLLFPLHRFMRLLEKILITMWLALVARVIFALYSTGLEYNFPFHEYWYSPLTNEPNQLRLSGSGQRHQLQKLEFMSDPGWTVCYLVKLLKQELYCCDTILCRVFSAAGLKHIWSLGKLNKTVTGMKRFPDTSQEC